jgi:hypothetical protein
LGHLGLPPLALQPEIQQALVVLAQHLPRAAGHDWRHVLAPDASALQEQLKRGMALVQEHQALNASLSPLWDEATLSAGAEGIRLRQRRQALLANLPTPWAPALRESIQEALQRLADLDQERKQLSQAYDDQVFAQDLLAWLHEWNEANRAMWPFSAFKKKALVGKLAPYATATPAKPEDLASLVAMQKHRRALEGTAFPTLPEGLWAGLATRVDRVQATLKLQACLQAVGQGKAWEDLGLDPVAEGFAGPVLQQALADLRELQRIEGQLEGLAHLSQLTPLWQAAPESHASFEHAHRFMLARRQLGPTGALEGHHPEVLQALAGAQLAEDAKALARRHQVELQLAELAPLQAATHGLWRGLDTAPQEVEAAEQLQANLERALGLLAVQPNLAQRAREALTQLLGDGRAQLEPHTAFSQACRNLLEAVHPLPPLLASWFEVCQAPTAAGG